MNFPATVEIVAAVIFGVAVLHTFSTKFFERLAHSRPSLGCEQFGGGTIVERAGHASCTPSRRPQHGLAQNRCREPEGPQSGSNALASHEKGAKPNRR